MQNTARQAAVGAQAIHIHAGGGFLPVVAEVIPADRVCAGFLFAGFDAGDFAPAQVVDFEGDLLGSLAKFVFNAQLIYHGIRPGFHGSRVDERFTGAAHGVESQYLSENQVGDIEVAVGVVFALIPSAGLTVSS